MDNENELDGELSKAPGDPEKSWKDDIAATMDQLEAQGESQSELDEIFAPHMEALAAQGHTPASWTRMAIGVGQQLEQQFAANPEAYGAYREMTSATHFNSEWDRFRKANPDAESVRYAMGEHIRDTAPPKGETAQAALRPYKAVKAASKEPRNDNEDRRQSIGNAWDKTYGGR
jgi:hypothetical protein